MQVNEFQKQLREQGLENTVQLYYSIYHGFCTENADEQQQGRIKIRVPQVHGDAAPDVWAYPVFIGAGKKAGFVAVPAIGEGVWVLFKNGNPRFPVYLGGWYGRDDIDELFGSVTGGDYGKVSGYRSPSGNYIIFTDVEGSESTKVAAERGLVLLQGDGEAATLGDKNAEVLATDIQGLIDVVGQLNATLLALNTAFAAFATAVPPLAPACTAFTTTATTIQTQLATIAQSLQQLKTVEVPKTKSTKVRLS